MRKLTRLSVTFAAILAPSAANACVPPNVVFDFRSTWVSPKDEEVARVAEAFKARSDGRVKLSAQTDGSTANLQMSKRRAQAVKAALVRRGVPAQRIDVETQRTKRRDASARTVW